MWRQGGGAAALEAQRQAEEGGLPHAHYDVPYKSLVLARLERQLPAMRTQGGGGGGDGGGDVASKLREMARPGREHPSEPRHIHPTQFYAQVRRAPFLWVVCPPTPLLLRLALM